MKEKDILRIEQIEDVVLPYRPLTVLPPPRGGWLRAIREALGMSSAQLAKKMGKKAAQTIEDIQESEQSGAIKLNTLREVAEAMGCQLVYAVVPNKSINDLRGEQARALAKRKLKRVFHTMKLEEQGVSGIEEQRELERMIKKLLDGNPRKLWE